MGLIYRTLRIGFRLAIDLYFVEVHATGRSSIPTDGPVIFAANHPNSLMDAVLLSIKTRRQVAFLGRAGLFSNQLASRLLDAVGVIPVYRRGDDPAAAGKNADTFRRAHGALADGRALGIFPEGRNSQEHHVGEIRTGAARIGLEAESKHDWTLGVAIVPVGISYENRDAFLSAALLRFGTPIELDAWKQRFEADARLAVQELTDEVGAAIRTQALHIADGRLKDLTTQLWEIADSRMLARYLPDDAVSIRPRWRGLIDQLRSTVEPRPEIDGVFEAKRALADALERIRRERPREWMLLRNAAQRHVDHVAQLELRDEVFRYSPSATRAPIERLKQTGYALAFGPLALWGFLTNAPQYLLIRHIMRSNPDEALRTVTGVAVGLTLGPVAHGLLGYWFWRTGTPAWLALMIVLTMVPSGFFFLRYRTQLARYRSRILARVLFRRRRDAIDSVFTERRRLIARLEELLNADEVAELKAAEAISP